MSDYLLREKLNFRSAFHLFSILDKSQPPESKGTERSLSLRNRSKTKLPSITDDGNNLFVAIKTDPFAPTSILETQNTNNDQGLGKTRIFA